MRRWTPAVWKADLLDGKIDWRTGQEGGRVLGPHASRLTGRAGTLRGLSAITTSYVQLRVDPFYRRVQERRPEVAARRRGRSSTTC